MLAGGLERSGQRKAGDPTFGPYPPLTNPPAAGGAGGLFTHTLCDSNLLLLQFCLSDIVKQVLIFSFIPNPVFLIVPVEFKQLHKNIVVFCKCFCLFSLWDVLMHLAVLIQFQSCQNLSAAGTYYIGHSWTTITCK